MTVLFCDVVGSTPLGEQLEHESVRKVLTRFFDEMASVLERHGGTVEKYIGDAIVAFFGTPVLHEDDALRAVRAAAEMGTALDVLNAELMPVWGVSLRTRIGVNTGEVVEGSAAIGGAFVVSDAVNVAARLEQTAAPGEVVLGLETYALVRDAVKVDEGRVLSLKGKADRVTGFRLLDVDLGAGSPTRMSPAFVGRAREFEALRDAFETSLREDCCVLLTVLGAAGVGKSRLANEFADGLGQEARVVRGHCLPYGDGITFWPVAELVKDACGITTEDSREVARAKIQRAVIGSDQEGLIAERVAAIVGFAESPGGMQETFWAIRRFLECLQAERPLVVLFDDIQWAEPTFLDFVEYLAGWSRDARILAMCLARPDLLDMRPSWTGALAAARTLELLPLSEDESGELIANLLGASPLDAADAARIVEAAEGNPLFVEEMLRMLEDDGWLARQDDGWRVVGDLSHMAVPATIQALLAARLDRLSGGEKAVLGTASVIGKEFWWGAVAELMPEDVVPRVGSHLQTLIRKGLITPERSTIAGEDAFRFHHTLVLEAAYRGVPKERRADLHESFAAWIETRSGDRLVENEELVGYHLEQAHRYRLELAAPDEGVRALGVRASERLTAAGKRALAGGDMAAAANLLERAAALRDPADPLRLALLPELGEALTATGDFVRADRVLDEALRGAEAVGDRGLASHSTIMRLLLMESTAPKGRSEVALRELDRVIPDLRGAQRRPRARTRLAADRRRSLDAGTLRRRGRGARASHLACSPGRGGVGRGREPRAVHGFRCLRAYARDSRHRALRTHFALRAIEPAGGGARGPIDGGAPGDAGPQRRGTRADQAIGGHPRGPRVVSASRVRFGDGCVRGAPRRRPRGVRAGAAERFRSEREARGAGVPLDGIGATCQADARAWPPGRGGFVHRRGGGGRCRRRPHHTGAG